MRTPLQWTCILLILTASCVAQGKRLWVLRAPGEMVEYDPATFAIKQRVKMPADVMKASATSVAVNHSGHILFAPVVSLPLSEDDIKASHKAWFWNGQAATTIDQGIAHTSEDRGSNKAITESAPVPYLSTDGKHLVWFANQERRLQREDIDLSTSNTWQAWRTDLSGGGREELVSTKFPDCHCTTGTCEESCPVGVVWAPASGVDAFFLMTQFVAGQTSATYKTSTQYKEDAGKWNGTALAEPLQRVLDASSDGTVIVEAIPDTGCCGWSNQSNDQTLVLANGKKIAVFDEQATYKNPDYDVSFFTANVRLSPLANSVAMTISSTVQSNKPIQLAEQGQADPEESQRIRKALATLPAVAVKTLDDPPKQLALIPHASLVGWISDKELLIVEDHLLVVYNVGSGARRKSTVRVEDASRVFLR